MALTRPKYSNIQDTDWKQSCRAATTGSNIALSGAAPSTIDGVTLSLFDRILVKDQTDKTQNGIYYVTAVGTGQNGTWTRATDANTSEKVSSGLIVSITEGTTLAGSSYKLITPDPITLNTTQLTFSVWGAGGGGSAGGVSGQVQYNNLNAFAGATGITTSNGLQLTVTGGIQNSPIGNLTANTGAFTTLSATSTFTGTIINAATIGNTGASIIGNSVSAATIGNTGASIIGNSVSASTITGITFSAASNITRNSRNVPTYVAAASAPSSPLMGDFWYNSSTDVLYQYIFDGTNSQWVDISSGLQNASTSATANTLALRDASADLYATVFRGKATSAQYADLAENYLADFDYEPGTVVVFGGEREITTTTQSHDTRVAGVISTAPAYLMNSECEGLPVAFTGRVPCKVIGTVRKGDVLVTSTTPGVAQAIDPEKYNPGCVIGKSLEDKVTTDVATIEIVVGRF